MTFCLHSFCKEEEIYKLASHLNSVRSKTSINKYGIRMSTGYSFVKHIKIQCYEHSLNVLTIPSVYEAEKRTGKCPKMSHGQHRIIIIIIIISKQ